MNVRAKVTLRHGTTLGDLLEQIENIPHEAIMVVNTQRADRPGETSYSTIDFVWDI